MKTSHYLFILPLLCVAAFPGAAQAQSADNTATAQRIERMEHDLMLLQKQVARGEGASTPAGSTGVIPANPAQLDVRLSAMDDQIRELRGKVEESEFKVNKLSETVTKFQQDTQFRLDELAHPQAAATPPAATAPAAPTPLAAPASTSGTLAVPPETPAAAPKTEIAPLAAQTQVSQAASQAPATFATPREHYNYAFRLLNETKYAEAAAMFDDFIKKYPKDALIGNAYYWGGESFYIRHDYNSAADRFRQGFETMPEGSKAADNLLKLAMSLSALKRDEDACVVLAQISTKFKKKSATVADKAETEYKRIGCK